MTEATNSLTLPADYTILIIEDNPTNLQVIANFLHEHQFNVAVARTATLGLQRAESGQPDLILLDIMLPDMNGFEVCQQLKSQATTRHIPVVFMTALVSEADRVQGFEVGAVDYITKPFLHGELLARLSTHLRLKELSNAMQEKNADLQRLLHETEGLFHAAQAILGANDLHEICHQLINHFVNLVQANSMALYLVDHNQRQVILNIDYLRGRLEFVDYEELDRGLSGLVFRSKQPILSFHADDGLEPRETRQRRKDLGVGPLIVVPLITKNEVIGTITAINLVGQGAFTPHDVDLLMSLATQAAAAIQNVRLFEQEQQQRQIAEGLREAAEQANRAKTIFLANMSHELRTPLNAVLGFSQLMQRDPQLTPTQAEHLKIINHSGEHLLNLINDVLEMSKVEAGRMTLHETTVNLPALLSDVETMFHVRAGRKGLNLVVKWSGEVPQSIKVDEEKLRQVLINLLQNAVKFTEQGQVTLEVKRVEATVLEFVVTDTGYGISDAELSKIFQIFSQTESGRKSQQGTGLGLVISQTFVQMMGGHITVTSQLGHGTTFRFTLPVQANEPVGVQFEYVRPSGEMVEVKEAISWEQVVLPEDIRARLREATIAGKYENLLNLAAEIGQTDTSLGHHILHLVENFDYAQILAIVDK